MFGAKLKATNGSFQKGMAFCSSIYATKDMKLLAFIFEQPLYSTKSAKKNIFDHISTSKQISRNFGQATWVLMYNVHKKAKIRNRYNHVSHLTHDTIYGKVTKHKKTPQTREPRGPRGQPFPSR